MLKRKNSELQTHLNIIHAEKELEISEHIKSKKKLKELDKSISNIGNTIIEIGNVMVRNSN